MDRIRIRQRTFYPNTIPYRKLSVCKTVEKYAYNSCEHIKHVTFWVFFFLFFQKDIILAMFSFSSWVDRKRKRRKAFCLLLFATAEEKGVGRRYFLIYIKLLIKSAEKWVEGNLSEFYAINSECMYFYFFNHRLNNFRIVGNARSYNVA